MSTITWHDFENIDIRSGTIIKAERFEKARKPAYKIWVDFGPLGIKQTSAQVTIHYTPENLINKRVLGCVNLGTKNIAGFESQFLLLGFADPNGDIYLASYDSGIMNGQKLM